MLTVRQLTIFFSSFFLSFNICASSEKDLWTQCRQFRLDNDNYNVTDLAASKDGSQLLAVGVKKTNPLQACSCCLLVNLKQKETEEEIISRHYFQHAIKSTGFVPGYDKKNPHIAFIKNDSTICVYDIKNKRLYEKELTFDGEKLEVKKDFQSLSKPKNFAIKQLQAITSGENKYLIFTVAHSIGIAEFDEEGIHIRYTFPLDHRSDISYKTAPPSTSFVVSKYMTDKHRTVILHHQFEGYNSLSFRLNPNFHEQSLSEDGRFSDTPFHSSRSQLKLNPNSDLAIELRGLSGFHKDNAHYLFPVMAYTDTKNLLFLDFLNYNYYWEGDQAYGMPYNQPHFITPLLFNEGLASINSLSFSPCAKYLAIARSDHTISVLNVRESLTPGTNPKNLYPSGNKSSLEGHTSPVNSVVWLDNNTLISSSGDSNIRVWSLNKGEDSKTNVSDSVKPSGDFCCVQSDGIIDIDQTGSDPTGYYSTTEVDDTPDVKETEHHLKYNQVNILGKR